MHFGACDSWVLLDAGAGSWSSQRTARLAVQESEERAETADVASICECYTVNTLQRWIKSDRAMQLDGQRAAAPSCSLARARCPLRGSAVSPPPLFSTQRRFRASSFLDCAYTLYLSINTKFKLIERRRRRNTGGHSFLLPLQSLRLAVWLHALAAAACSGQEDWHATKYTGDCRG
jgi:hypothetical protein